MLRTTGRSYVLAAGLSVALLLPAQANAQPSDPGRRAEVTFNEGMKLAKDQQLEAALAKFELSYATSPNGRTLFQMARLERLLQQYALALQHFRQVLKDPALAQDAREESLQAVEDLKTKVGVISIEAPPGSTVMVDLVQVEPTSTLEVVPGLHVVKARLGSEQRSVDINCLPGKPSMVKIRFDDKGAGRDAGSGQGSGHDNPTPSDPQSSPLRIIVPIGLGVVGVAGLVTGGVFLSKANDSVDEARSLGVNSGCVGVSSPSCDRARSLQDDWKTQSTVSTVSFVTGGVLLAVAGVSYVLWPRLFGPRTSASRPTGLTSTQTAPFLSWTAGGLHTAIAF